MVTQDDADAAALALKKVQGEQGSYESQDPLVVQKAADRSAGITAVASAGSAWGCTRPARFVPPGPAD